MLNLTAPSVCTLEVSQEINWSSRQDLHPGTGAHHFSLPPSPFYWFPLTSSHRLSTPSFWLPTPMLCGFRWRDLLLCLRLRWILCLGYSALLFCPQMDSSAHSYWKASQRSWTTFQKETTKSLMFLPWASWRKHNSQLNHCAIEVGGGPVDGTDLGPVRRFKQAVHSNSKYLTGI